MKKGRMLIAGLVLVVAMILVLEFMASEAKTGQHNGSEAKRHFELAKILRDDGDLNQAIVEAEKAIQFDPGLLAGHVLLGSLYYFNNETEKSIETYRTAIKLDPKNTDTYVSLGVVYTVNNRFDELAKLFDEALKQNPKSSELCFQSGNAHMQLRHYPQAIEKFKQGLKIDPQHKNMHYALGLVHHLNHDDKSARQEQTVLKEIDAALAEKLGKMMEAKDAD